MPDKLFPGVSHQDIIDQENRARIKNISLQQMQELKYRASLESQKKQEQEKKQYEFNITVDYFFNKYGNFGHTVAHQFKKFLFRQSVTLGCFYALFGMASVGELVATDSSKNLMHPVISASDIRILENNTNEYSIVPVLQYITNPALETYNFANIFRPDVYKSFTHTYKPENKTVSFVDWRILRAYIGLIMVLLYAGYGLRHIIHSRRYKKHTIKKLLIAWEHNDFETIDKLLNITTRGRLARMAGKIVDEMSGDDRAAFEKIINGDINVSKYTAIKIMQGHLKKHPSDIQKIMDTFDERSIPDVIKLKYMSKTK